MLSVLAIALVSSATFFSQAVDTVIMRQELADYAQAAGRPAFSSRIFAASTRTVPLTLERAETLGRDVADTLASEVGLTAKSVVLLADSGALTLKPKTGDTRYAGKEQLGNAGVIWLRDAAPHLTITGGEPFSEAGTSTSALAVWMHADLAAKLGLQVGDQFDLRSNSDNTDIPIQVAGFWRAADAKDSSFWFSDADSTLRDKLLVRRADYLALVEPKLKVKVRSATWYVI